MPSKILVVAILAALAGCSVQRVGEASPDQSVTPDDGGVPPGSDGGGPPPPSGDMAIIPPSACTGSLTIAPADLVMYVDGKNSFTQSYQVICQGFDVTAGAALTVDDVTLGSFSGATFASTPGAAGNSTVRAKYGSATGATTISLQLTTQVLANGAPMNAPSEFGGGSDPQIAPPLVYPPDGVMIPPNLNLLEFQFEPQGQWLFRVTFSVGNTKILDVYTPCVAVGGGCAYTPDAPTWAFVSQLSKNQTMTWTVAGTDGKGGPVGTSSSRGIHFSKEDATGGLYYWAAAAGGIYRYDFGLRGQSAESFYTPAQAGNGLCVGCHALSRDGTRMAVGLNIPGPAQMRMIDVATKKDLFDVGSQFQIGAGSNFETLTSTASKLITTEGGNLTIRDATTGQTVGGTLSGADMPDLSPDDQTVVFARSANMTCVFGLCDTLSVVNASLYTASFSGTQFGSPKLLVAAANQNEDNYYPSFSPDGKYVVFNRSEVGAQQVDMGSEGGSYDAPDAAVWIVPAGGGAPVALDGVNQIAGNSWCKWAPFVHHFGGSNILWITFSSKRPYGLHGGSNAQLWMVAVDEDKLLAGQDPGYPAFWLPFQDFSTDNHIAQWATKVVRPPCDPNNVDNGGCPNGTYCSSGQCVPNPG